LPHSGPFRSPIVRRPRGETRAMSSCVLPGFWSSSWHARWSLEAPQVARTATVDLGSLTSRNRLSCSESAGLFKGPESRSAALSVPCQGSAWPGAVSLVPSRYSRQPMALVCHACHRPRARAYTPTQVAEFSLQELRISVSQRTSATIPSNRLSLIRPDPV